MSARKRRNNSQERPSSIDLLAQPNTARPTAGDHFGPAGDRAPIPSSGEADLHQDPYNILLALRSVRHLMTVKEVAGLFGTSVFAIYRMVRRNQIPHMHLGGSLRFDPSVLELWLIRKQPELAAAARRLASAA